MIELRWLVKQARPSFCDYSKVLQYRAKRKKKYPWPNYSEWQDVPEVIEPQEKT